MIEAGTVVGGSVAPGFELVAEAFARNLREHELGAAFAACVDGRPVVDLWGGVADPARHRRWTEDTVVPVFSGSKGLVATCMLMLVERGRLRLDEPVARWWPEFAAHGKDEILVGEVLTHRARLPGPTTPLSVEEATDDVRVAQLLAAQAPLPASAPRLVYHAVTFGWLCGELVRRVDGRSVGRFLAEEVAAPLGLEMWIGLPERCEPRVALLDRDATFGGEVVGVGRDEDALAWSIWSNPPRYGGGQLAANRRDWHAAEIPGANAIVSARSLARLYGCLARGGELDGVRLLSPETLARETGRVVRGEDPYLGEMAFAGGFQVQTSERYLGPEPDAFGHPGAGGSVHGAWPRLRVGFSYAPNLLRSLGGPDPRAMALLDTLHACAVAA